MDFDIQQGRQLRDDGIETAASHRKYYLELARHAVKAAALKRVDRTATADDAFRYFKEMDIPADNLGRAAGRIFLSKEWEKTGCYVPSKRVSNHARPIAVWRLKGDTNG